jgi:hypothetical protein
MDSRVTKRIHRDTNHDCPGGPGESQNVAADLTAAADQVKRQYVASWNRQSGPAGACGRRHRSPDYSPPVDSCARSMPGAVVLRIQTINGKCRQPL